MRVAIDKLGGDAGRDVVDVPTTLSVLVGFGGDAGMEHDLHQQVAELLAKMIAVAAVERLKGLVRLFEQIVTQRLVRLLPGPRALPPEPVHHLNKIEQARARHIV